MKNNNSIKIGLIFGITVMFIFSSFVQMTAGYNKTISDRKLGDECFENYAFDRWNESQTFDFSDYKKQISYEHYDYDFLSEETTAMEQTSFVTGGPMDSPWPMKCQNNRHTSRSPYSTAGNSGFEKWRFKADDCVEGSPIIGNDGIIYFGDFDYYLYALYPNGTLKWRYETGGWIWSAPSIGKDGIVYVTSYDSRLHALYSNNGTLKWSIGGGGSISSSPAIAEDGTIYFGAMGPGNKGRINGINPNGTKKWEYDTGYWIVSDPAVGDDDTVYIGSGDTYLYALYPNGTLRWSTPYNWESLMDKHEQDDGLSCTLVTIQNITACTDYHNSDPLFNDTEAHIREFCKDAYEDWGTSYIFVGGDAEWIPARLMDSSAEPRVDSDIYWSNLDKTFNDDHDNYWGEEGDLGFDLYSELFIGRITCDEPQDVSNWMTKSFYYADATDMDYLENAGFYGLQNSLEYSAIYGFETWNSNHPAMPYNLSVKWTGDSSPNPGWQGGSTRVAVAGLKNAINNDHVTLLSGIAHANAGMSLDVGMNSWESDYHNTKPFFIFDLGSHCGDMDAADDGVLHSMLFHSDTELAFACVYNTCYGWGSCNVTNSSSALQMKLFWDHLFDLENNSVSPMNWQLGKAMAYSKDTMAPTIDPHKN